MPHQTRRTVHSSQLPFVETLPRRADELRDVQRGRGMRRLACVQGRAPCSTRAVSGQNKCSRRHVPDTNFTTQMSDHQICSTRTFRRLTDRPAIRESVHTGGLAAPRPKSVAEAEKVRLVDRIQHLDGGALDDLVFQRGNTERSLPPVCLRDVHPPNRLRPVPPALQPSREVPEVCPPVSPRSAATSPRRPPARRLASARGTPPETIDVVDVVQERREPHLLIPSCRLTYPLQRTERAVPARCPGRVLLVAGSLWPDPFPPSPPPTGCPALFGDFAGTRACPTSLVVHRRRASLDFPTRPAARHPPRATRDLPVLARGVSVHARGL